MANKVYPTAADAVADIPSGATLAVGRIRFVRNSRCF